MFPTLKKNVDRKITAGVAGRPHVPARTVTVTEKKCGIMASGSKWESVESETGNFQNGEPVVETVLVQVSDSSDTGSNVTYRYVCQEVTYTVRYPEVKAIPTIPSELVSDYRLGWNSNTIARNSVQRGGGVRFSLPRSVVGVSLGLTRHHRESGVNHIAFGFSFSRGIASVFESGNQILSLGSYQDSDRFEVVRYAGQIWYRKNGELVHQRENTDDTLEVSVSMYSGDDSVANPEMVYTASSSTALHPLRGFSRGLSRTSECPALDTTTPATLQALCGLSWGSAPSATRVYANLPFLKGRSHPGTRSHTSLPLFRGLASEGSYSRSHGALQALTGYSGEEGLLPDYCISDGMLPGIISASVMNTGQIANANAQLQPLRGLSSEGDYSRSNARLPVRFRSTSFALHESEIFNAIVISMGRTSLELLDKTYIAVVMHSESQAMSVFSFDLHLFVEMFGEAQAGSLMSASHTMQVLLMSATAANPVMDVKGQEDLQVWVANLKNAAFSRYDGFEFNSYAKVEGKYYGAKADGIYLLEGDTDSGRAIDASVRLGRTAFGSSVNKSLPGCYLGVASSGKMYMKVTANGKTYTYAARASSSDMQTQRVDMGRGLRATHYEFEVANKNGDQFELENVEFIAVPLTRRV